MAKTKKKSAAKSKPAAKKTIAKKAAPSKKPAVSVVSAAKPAVAKTTKKKNLTILWLLIALTGLLYFIAIVRLGQGY